MPARAAVSLTGGPGSQPTIKRSDERAITMTAFDNPAFVEDMVRDLSLLCCERGVDHQVAVRNLESIHSHDAVAEVVCTHSTGHRKGLDGA